MLVLEEGTAEGLAFVTVSPISALWMKLPIEWD